MSYLSDPQYLKTQYATSSNLEARITLHKRFSRNPQSWAAWVFEQFQLPAACRLLELGCGPGVLWSENQERIPPGWGLTFSDFSAGMARQACQSLKGMQPAPRFAQLNAERLPFPPDTFDAVLANHMLYHVPDLSQALRDIRRVLRPGGRLFAATNGEQHMAELDQLARDYDARLDLGDPRLIVGFSLENGASQLAKHFSHVELRRYPGGLDVTDAAPLAAYIASMGRYAGSGLQHEALERWLEAELARQGGVLRITIDVGMFIAARN